jgi:hypothetical protein
VASTPSARSEATARAIRSGVSGSSSVIASTRERPPRARIASSSPAQRWSRPVLPTCWLMQIARLTPARASRTPAARPARNSSWPTWASTPNERNCSLPELIDTTGMPALTARRIAGLRPGSGIETTSPSGLVATASSISSLIRSSAYSSGER